MALAPTTPPIKLNTNGNIMQNTKIIITVANMIWYL